MNKTISDLPIGVFDSGVGGLTVLAALRNLLPEEDFLYLGDTARVPYGTKSAESVSRYAVQAAGALVKRGIKMLVVACNTASAVSIEPLKDYYRQLDVIGVVRPGARAACKATESGNIAVIATESTVNGGAYEKAIKSIRPDAHVISAPCQLFVALAEEGWGSGEIAEAVARKYLNPLFASFGNEKPDSLVLGCTHFPVLKTAIAAAAGPGVQLVDSAGTTALEVKQMLADRDMFHSKGHKGEYAFMATDCAERFAKVGSAFLGEEVLREQVEIVDL
ncbi:glutamate racemase [Maridesulfovibrio bastinii]|uniref:glutamate racemase n=1 Tax=Maridesulfovibrio bastinii TaxID=47157 RepID=UPI0004166454|nr:glutamate racemase [Maridesulfovibrio bastinii]